MFVLVDIMVSLGVIWRVVEGGACLRRSISQTGVAGGGDDVTDEAGVFR
jgi:hypothetical protein